MEPWVEEMEGWETRPFAGGYAGLRELAADEFSGAVSTGDTWLFMVNGRVLAVVEHPQTGAGDEVTDADIERFENSAERSSAGRSDGASPSENSAEGTAYVAPDPSVALLVAMKTCDGDTRGKYYTEKTAVDDVIETLSDGGFTGYVELSENVLSGDYYAILQGGRSTHLAFIGNARRLLTDEEARERMTDEIGIYRVVAVDLDVVDVPGSDSPEGTAEAGAAGADAVNADGGAAAVNDDDGTTDEATTGEATTGEATTGDGAPDDDADVTAGGDEPAAAESAAAEAATAATADEPDADERESGAAADEAAGDAAGARGTTDGVEAANVTATDADAGATLAADLASRSVPSLDPSRSGTGADRSTATDESTRTERSTDPPDTADDAEIATTGTTDVDAESGAGPAAGDASAAVEVLREEVRVAREELAVTKAERDELAARVEELESRLAELEDGGAGAERAEGPSLSVDEAFAGTNLFVRYGSKGALTLADVREGAGDADELAANLRLEHHTRFEEAGATVDGRPFQEWLEGTQRFRFLRWVAATLPFEIRETGAVDGLRDLYDALPDLDRVELDGDVTVEDGDDEREVTFGLVGRDRTGDPLVVADLDTARDPVDETAMAGLVTDASAAAETHDSLGAAFYVTAAFFEPAALETAGEATGGSLLSRDRRRSFVKLSRTRGFHLALVESRDASFHLSVPDL